MRGIPQDLLAEDDLAVDHGGGFAVAGAQVEADPAAAQVAADGDGAVERAGEGRPRSLDQLERPVVRRSAIAASKRPVAAEE